MEIRKRRKWDAVDFWVSDRSIRVDRLSYVNNRYRKNIWIYFGTTTPGSVTVDSVKLDGDNSQTTLKGFTEGVIRSGRHRKFAVCVDAPNETPKLSDITVRYTKNGTKGSVLIALRTG